MTLHGLSRFLNAHSGLAPLRTPLGRLTDTNPSPRVQLLRAQCTRSQSRRGAGSQSGTTTNTSLCSRWGCATAEGLGSEARVNCAETAVCDTRSPCHCVSLWILLSPGAGGDTHRGPSDAAPQLPPANVLPAQRRRGWGAPVGTETAPEAAHLRGVSEDIRQRFREESRDKSHPRRAGLTGARALSRQRRPE